jgi:uncharacterized protein (DUF1778 family)
MSDETDRIGPKRIARRDRERKLTALKVMPDVLREIDRRAEEAGLTRTDFMTRKALDLPTGVVNLDDRMEAFEERLRRLEEVTFGAVGR